MSLRLRLALGYVGFFALVLALTSLGGYLLLRRLLMGQMREELKVSAELIVEAFALKGTAPASFFTGPEALETLLPASIPGLESSTLYVQVFDGDGDLIATSATLRRQVLPVNIALLHEALAGAPQEVIEPLGTTRVLGELIPLKVNGHIVGILHLATSLRAVDRALNLLLLSSVVGNIVALLAALRGGAWLARGALAPVDAVAATARQIVRADDLHRRVQESPTNDEIGRLTHTINELLARLETLFTQQQRFIADVSHELRTPLTAMRGNLELLRGGMAEDSSLLDESLADMAQEVDRLTRMANDLLLLAQAEAGVELSRQTFALDDLVLEVYRELQPLAKLPRLTVNICAQVAFLGDRDRLKQALLNLGANAIQHTPAGGIITLGLDADASWVRLSVRDSGPGIAPEVLPHLFERFYRADKARLRRSGGAGLGLSIVRWVAEAHDGRVEVESSAGAGSNFTLVLPLILAPQLAQPAPLATAC